MEPDFRLATLDDIDTLMVFVRDFYALDQYPFDEQITRRTLEKMIQDDSLGRIWLICEANTAIGYVALTFGYSIEYHGRDAFIDELFIQAEQRKRGIGTKTIQFVLAACREFGVHALHLEVERGNSAGQALYRKAGFEDHDRYLLTRWIEP